MDYNGMFSSGCPCLVDWAFFPVTPAFRVASATWVLIHVYQAVLAGVA